MNPAKSKPQWKVYLTYVLIVVLVLFIVFNRQPTEINLIFVKMPKLPLAIWLFIMMALGFFLGRSNIFKKKVKVQ